MILKREKIIGILGGMGPYATIEFYKKILDLTPVKKDWDHSHVIIDSNPKIPSRSRAILYGETSPLPMMIESAKTLEGAGADFILIPCNTAHKFYDGVKNAVSIPVLNIIEETSEYVLGRGSKKVGVLASEATIKTGLYEKSLGKRGIQHIKPSESDQRIISKTIEDVKIKNNNKDTKANILAVIMALKNKGADGIILGCTELTIVLGNDDIGIDVFDSSQILAKAAVKMAKG